MDGEAGLLMGHSREALKGQPILSVLKPLGKGGQGCTGQYTMEVMADGQSREHILAAARKHPALSLAELLHCFLWPAELG